MSPTSPCAPRLLAALSLALVGVASGSPRAEPLWLPPPASASAESGPRERALATLRARAGALGLSADDLADVAVVQEAEGATPGTRVLYLRQRLHGLEIRGADWSCAVLPDGRLLGGADRFVRIPAGLVSRPRLSARQATRLAELALGVESGASERGGVAPDRAALARHEPKLRYLRVGGGRSNPELRLSWNLTVGSVAALQVFDVDVDARSGELLAARPLVHRAAYRALPLEVESPLHGARGLHVDPADPDASPQGWHDRNGVPGGDFTDTSTFAADVQEDADGDNFAGFSPDGGPELVFDFPLDPSRDPSTHQAASITNAFYQVSTLHDRFARLGFDPAAGNFQKVNPAGIGGSGDPVVVDVQDGSSLDAATFFVLADGVPGRMTLGVWGFAELHVDQPAEVAGTYAAGWGAFGPALTLEGSSAAVVLALDTADSEGPSTTDGCSTLQNASAIAGALALIDRGDCPFTQKVSNAQEAGAVGAIVANDEGDSLLTMLGSAPDIAIPSLFVGQSTGQLLRGAAGAHGTIAGYARDSALDSGVVVHEYAHGVSKRLAGGRHDATCLSELEGSGMGEGLSDWWAIAFTARPGDRPGDPRTIGTYVAGQTPDGPGLRSVAYTTDASQNALHYGQLDGLTQPHDVGEIWASALWQLYWNLVGPYGFDAAWLDPQAGNTRVARLVIEATKLLLCEPTFLDGRDALVAADLLLHDGRDRCRIWDAFSRRGMGPDALADEGGVVEDFLLPPDCGRCGDVSDDGQVDLIDATLLRRSLADLGPPLLAPEKCNTRGPLDPEDADGDGRRDDCDEGDADALREALASSAPAPAQLCESAAPLSP